MRAAKDNVQRGKQPDDIKPMPVIGRGVRRFSRRGTFRVVYSDR